MKLNEEQIETLLENFNQFVLAVDRIGCHRLGTLEYPGALEFIGMRMQEGVHSLNDISNSIDDHAEQVGNVAAQIDNLADAGKQIAEALGKIADKLPG